MKFSTIICNDHACYECVNGTAMRESYTHDRKDQRLTPRHILASMLFERPGLFDRADPLHPLIPWTPELQPALNAVPILICAGQHDPICPFPQSLALISWFKSQGADVGTAIEPGGHEIGPAELKALQEFLGRRA